METNEVEKKLDAADSILTKIKTLLKKHWGILLFLLFSYCVYWAFTQPAPVQEEQYQEPVQEEQYQESVQEEPIQEEQYNTDNTYMSEDTTATYQEVAE